MTSGQKKKHEKDTLKVVYGLHYKSFSYDLYIFENKEKKYIYLASCFNSSMCIDWQILKSSTASFSISWFARLQDLRHTNNQEFDLKKMELETRGNKLLEAHLYDVFKILVSSTL